MEPNKSEQLFRKEHAVNGHKYCGVLSFLVTFWDPIFLATRPCFHFKNFLDLFWGKEDKT